MWDGVQMERWVGEGRVDEEKGKRKFGIGEINSQGDLSGITGIGYDVPSHVDHNPDYCAGDAGFGGVEFDDHDRGSDDENGRVDGDNRNP
ncbi:hypothetical protein N7493_009289 [Penicillium malachiteum]|uniref:Uncharacterized protein n=1 Tax=Penicillium malachiteum TaxID=1324776 RepID=A0AAD6HGU1_9EURO|nr:hypothetical protein N7493_009289 [Penicillium malachiteum]